MKHKIQNAITFSETNPVNGYITESRIIKGAKSMTDEQVILLCPVRPWIKNQYHVPKKSKGKRKMILNKIINYIFKMPDDKLKVFKEAMESDKIHAFKILLARKGKFINNTKGG